MIKVKELTNTDHFYLVLNKYVFFFYLLVYFDEFSVKAMVQEKRFLFKRVIFLFVRQVVILNMLIIVLNKMIKSFYHVDHVDQDDL